MLTEKREPGENNGKASNVELTDRRNKAKGVSSRSCKVPPWRVSANESDKQCEGVSWRSCKVPPWRVSANG